MDNVNISDSSGRSIQDTSKGMTENKRCAFKAPLCLTKSGVRVESRMDGTEHWMSQAAHWHTKPELEKVPDLSAEYEATLYTQRSAIPIWYRMNKRFYLVIKLSDRYSHLKLQTTTKNSLQLYLQQLTTHLIFLIFQ